MIKLKKYARMFGKTNPNYKHGKDCIIHYCIDCGNKVSDYRKTRCMSCFLVWLHNKNFKGGKSKCIDCGKQVTQYGLVRCHSCENKRRWTNKSYKKNTRKNISKAQIALYKKYPYKHPRWTGGISKEGYPYEFTDELKELIRKECNYICQYCGLKQENHFRGKKNIRLTVHHIDYNKLNCKRTNLICLCSQCNLNANNDRDFWVSYYIYLKEHKDLFYVR